MEGAYHKILQSRSSIPSPQFQVFLEMLVSTVRDAIAVSVFAQHSSLLRARSRIQTSHLISNFSSYIKFLILLQECAEDAYAELTAAHASRLLMFSNHDEFLACVPLTILLPARAFSRGASAGSLSALSQRLLDPSPS
jgi:hypothetical protein